MKNVPQELILEILLRLPVKSALRFKSVCKSWLSLISNPQFAKSHFDLAAAQTNRIFFVTVNEARSLDFEASFHDVSASVKLNFPLAPPFSNVRIWGSCRGFLLLDVGENFFVYNPSTGVRRRISNSPVKSSKLFSRAFHGIGYDASKDDYLVVLGSYYIEVHWEFIVTLFEIFSFKMNSWKIIQDTDFPYIGTSETRVGLLFNGALHWIAFRYDMLEDVILAFDLIEEKPRELPVPHDFNSLPSCHVAELGGCLSLCTKEDGTVYIWIMKEYGVKSSWSKSVVLSLAATTHYYISPICTTKSGEIVGQDDSLHLASFVHDDSLELVRFNYRGELLEHRAYSDIPPAHNDIPHHCRCKAAVYTESLLSLPSGSEEGGEDLQQS